jgi:cytochrome c oxidase subunit III
VEGTLKANPAKTGVWIGVATIAMSFAAFTSAMFVRQSDAADWQVFRLPTVLYFNTLILAISSATLELSRQRITATDAGIPSSSRVRSWLYVTLALGLLFVCGQVLAWRSLAAQGLFLSTSPSSSFFYVLTALHGIHLLGGVGGLLYVLSRLGSSSGARAKHLLGVAAIYWHFMGALWMYLLLILALRA